MKRLVSIVSIVSIMSMVVVATAATAASAQSQPQPPPQPTAEMQAAMAKAKKFTQPGEPHKLFDRFVGKWTTEMRFYMGPKAMPAEMGTTEYAWLMPGRWLKGETTGTLMGRPAKSFFLLGCDNFKQSYVFTTVSTMDTAMNHAEGDMDPGGKALIMYGTIDEYLTGEHDKMVKYVFRFLSPDKIVLEVHDLPIGETNTKVLEITYTRTTS
jgi:hypothetical protein